MYQLAILASLSRGCMCSGKQEWWWIGRGTDLDTRGARQSLVSWDTLWRHETLTGDVEHLNNHTVHFLSS